MLGALATLTSLLGPAVAQELLRESFDATGASGGETAPALEAAGWIFSNQSAGTVTSGYQQSPSSFPLAFAPHEGTGFLGLSGQSSDWGTHKIARWLILPAIGLAGGEEVTLWISDDLQGSWERFELRYSPTRALGTGSGPDQVGDFTDVLAVENFVSDSWKEIRATVPGSGRLALRLYTSAFGPTFMGVGLDELVIRATPASPPLPAPGETVHWTRAMSPIVIDQEWTILPAGTVVIDRGVEIVFEGTGVLRVQGNLQAEGTTAQPVRLRAGATSAVEFPLFVGWFDFGDPGPLVPATARLRHVISTLGMRAKFGASVVATDSQFGTPPLSELAFDCEGATLVLMRCTVSAADLVLRETWLQLEDDVFDGAQVFHGRRHVSTTSHVDRCTFRNVLDDAPWVAEDGNDVFFGPDNSIANNLYPLRLEGGGIAPGSTLPTSGNLNDFVRGGSSGSEGRTTLAAIDIPYRFNFLAGNVVVEPGTRILMEPGGRIRVSPLVLHGTPAAPITVEPANPAQGWARIFTTSDSGRPKVESVHVRGADAGAQIAEGTLFVFDCLFETCNVGVRAGMQFGLVFVERSRFLGNAIGMQTDPGTHNWSFVDAGDLIGGFPANPNWIEGNGIGVDKLWDGDESTLDARYNWWGDPSGPQHPANPGGQGDLADPAAQVMPFLSTAPDFDDHPPVVRFQPMNRFVRDGTRMILHWTVEEDGAVVAQRLEYTPHANNPPLSIVVPFISPDARSLEVVVPAYVPSSNIADSVWRIVAVDDAGQEGWSEVQFSHVQPGTPALLYTPDLSQGVSVGQRFALRWTPTQSGNVHLLLDDVPEPKQNVDLGWALEGELGILSNDIPAVSTDLARYGLFRAYSSHDHVYWMSDYFAIRPQALAGDAPPVVSLTSPRAGELHLGGELVPVRWTASDDRALRSFDLQASYDGGYTWHFVIRDLPPTARDYGWQLPFSEGIAGVELRVIARDDRFQVSSDGTGRAFSIVPNSGSVGTPYCFGDDTGIACPCGNTGDAGHGCGNSTFPAGSKLSGTGRTSVSADSLVLRAIGVPPGAPGLFFQCNDRVAGGLGAPLGNGLRCAGGSLVRLQVKTANALGTVLSSLPLAEAGGVGAGQTRYYQLWHRDPVGLPCGAPFNLSNGLEITWD